MINPPRYPFDTEDECLLHFTPGIGGVPWSSDPWGWPDDLFSYRVLDWRGGDGITPLVGSSLVATGSTSATKTPYTGKHGAITGELFSSTETYYAGAYDLNPDASNDVILSFLFCNSISGRDSYIYNSYDGSKGITFAWINSANTFRWTVVGDSTVTIDSPLGNFSWGLCELVLNRTAGTLTQYTNGIATASVAAPTGTYVSTASFTLSAAASNNLTGTIGRARIFRGAGIGAKYTIDYAKYYASAIFGLTPQKPGTPVSHTRTNSIISTVSTDLFSVGNNCPKVDPVKGIALYPALVNKCYKNIGLVSGDESYITVSSGLVASTAEVDLEFYNFYGFIDRVYEVSNDTGSDGYIRSGGVATNINPRSVSVRAHHTRGSGALIGLYCGVKWTCPTGTISDQFVRSSDLVTPDNASQSFSIKIPTATTLQFFLMNNVESPVLAPEIPNLSTNSSVSLTASSVNYGVTLTGTSALVEAEVAPDGWSTTAEGQARAILTDSISSGRHMEINSATQLVIVNDGTNNAQVAITETDGVYQTIRTGWGPKGLIAETSGTVDTDPYDGALGFGQAVSSAIYRWLRRLSIFRRER